MALVHQHLYGSDSLCRVNFAAYAREPVEGVQSTFTAGDSRVDLDFDLDPVELGIDQALPCALILNELVSNAFKYAFPGGKAGQIRIFFRRPEPERCELIVRDDGIGLQAGKLHGQETSLGCASSRS